MADMFKLEYTLDDEVRVAHINLDAIKTLDIEKDEDDDYLVYAYSIDPDTDIGYPMTKEQAIKQGFLKE